MASDLRVSGPPVPDASDREDIAMPSADNHDQRKAQDQEAERKHHAEDKSADDKRAVKEPESDSRECQAGNIIGNG